jgi:hypothetical protein
LGTRNNFFVGIDINCEENRATKKKQKKEQNIKKGRNVESKRNCEEYMIFDNFKLKIMDKNYYDRIRNKFKLFFSISTPNCNIPLISNGILPIRRVRGQMFMEMSINGISQV